MALTQGGTGVEGIPPFLPSRGCVHQLTPASADLVLGGLVQRIVILLGCLPVRLVGH